MASIFPGDSSKECNLYFHSLSRYQLVTFNDFGPVINLNVKLEVRIMFIVI